MSLLVNIPHAVQLLKTTGTIQDRDQSLRTGAYHWKQCFYGNSKDGVDTSLLYKMAKEDAFSELAWRGNESICALEDLAPVADAFIVIPRINHAF